MNLTERIRGAVRVEICGAFPESVLNAAAAKAVKIWGVESIDSYTLRFMAFEGDVPALEVTARRAMCDLRVIYSAGGSRDRALLKRRIVPTVLGAAVMVLLFVSSLFIWDVDVEGNEKLTEGEILRALEDCGVGVGSYWPDMDSDLIRCQMLLKLPELGWMTVNVHGSCADVLVTERVEKPEIYNETKGADVIAVRTGIIRSLTVLNGRERVAVNDAVTEGEVLISGTVESLTDEPQTVRARGSVKARTWYTLSALCPVRTEKKTVGLPDSVRVGVKFGKNRINFPFASRKTLDGCDKIIREFPLGVEGLFAMPVSVVVEEYRRPAVNGSLPPDVEGTKERLLAALRSGIDGEIVESRFTCGKSGEYICVTLHAACIEEIGVTEDNAAG